MFNVGDIVELDDNHKYYKYPWWSMRFHTFVVVSCHEYREHEVVIKSINNGLTPVVPIQALQLVNHEPLSYEEMM